MVAKVVFVCATALLAQVAYGQYLPYVGNQINLGNGISLGNGGIALANGFTNNGIYGLGNAGLIGTGIGNVGVVGAGLNGATLLGYPDLYNIGTSGPLPVTTISPIGPSGLAVASENVIEGILQVGGSLPFLSAVAFEGALPTAGSGLATCGCGNGAVGIISEGFPTRGPNGPLGPIGPIGLGGRMYY